MDHTAGYGPAKYLFPADVKKFTRDHGAHAIQHQFTRRQIDHTTWYTKVTADRLNRFWRDINRAAGASGDAYLNAHTLVSLPGGIRGQLR